MSVKPRKKILRKLGTKLGAKLGLMTKKAVARPKIASKPKPKARANAKVEVRAVQVAQPTDPTQAFLMAATFAARKHHGQMRADGQTPYFSHVMRVTLVLVHVFGVRDDDTITAALLHDTLEDTATDYDELAQIFGQRVADYVVLLTKNVMLPKEAREHDYRERLSEAPEAVMIAKMADIYDNLSDRINSPKLRKTASTAGLLLRVFGERVETPLGRAAHEKVSALLEEIKALRPEETT